MSLLTPELPAEIGGTVVERGHEVPGRKPGAALRGRCMIHDVSRACGGPGPHGWRQKEYPCGKLRGLCPGVARPRFAGSRPGDVEALVELALEPADRAERSRAGIDTMPGVPDSIRGFIGHVRHQADLTGRRILKGETVPRHGKVHPILNPHTRWIPKGRAASLTLKSLPLIRRTETVVSTPGPAADG